MLAFEDDSHFEREDEIAISKLPVLVCLLCPVLQTSNQGLLTDKRRSRVIKRTGLDSKM
jgi:hypothetical protein